MVNLFQPSLVKGTDFSKLRDILKLWQGPEIYKKTVT
jgi:hypothetical protein